DATNGVGELLAATPMSRTRYLFSKFFSNVVYLMTLAAPVALLSPALQFIRGEDTSLVFSDLFGPYLLIVLPGLCLIAALSVFFEVTPVLRGGWGNVIYFYAYLGLLMAPVQLGTEYDFVGIAILMQDMGEALRAINSDYVGGFSLGARLDQPAPAGSFVWGGVDWTAARLWTRLFWPALSLSLIALSIPLFNRFDPAGLSKRAARNRALGGGRLTRLARRLIEGSLAPLSLALGWTRFGRMFVAELRLALLGQHPLWYLVTLGLVIASLAAPLEVGHSALLPALWIWPILIWSQSGVRERVHRVDQTLFAAPHPVLRQTLSVWLAGVSVAALISSGFVLRALAAGEFAAVIAVLGSALLIPGLALATGVITGSARFFEITYLLIWYIGPLNRAPSLDFLGLSPESFAITLPWLAPALGCALLGLALLVRSRQLRA
ncbi:MAG TPA: hypothetical protein VLB27_07225, partial [candidate division Zixibacteria bacterium]|nr:hypothetical protein [candidate division Zixibacteria bacterium]